MKRFLSLAAAVMLLLSGALAQSEQSVSSLFGVVYYPRASTEDTASFAFRYQLPQVSAGHPQHEAINQYFSSYAADIVETMIPSTIDTLDGLPAAGEPAYYVGP